MGKTADQLEQAPTENKHDLPGPGKDFNGEQDLNFSSIAPARHPEHGAPGHSGSGWSFDKYRD